jgi:hypothetical protein
MEWRTAIYDCIREAAGDNSTRSAAWSAHCADMSEALNRSDAALDEHLREVRSQLSASPLSFPPLPSPLASLGVLIR